MKVLKGSTQLDMLPDDLDRAVEEAIVLADGDMRKAIRGLILGQRAIVAERDVQVSAGYVRGRLH